MRVTTELDTTEPDVISTGELNPPTERRRRRPDALALVMGLVSLAVAIMALTGWTPDLPALDPRWALAAGAMGLGVLLLAGTLRSPRERR